MSSCMMKLVVDFCRPSLQEQSEAMSSLQSVSHRYRDRVGIGGCNGGNGGGGGHDLSKSTIYPVAGALLGTCLGGPVGMLAGVKIGGLAAIGGSVFGTRSTV